MAHYGVVDVIADLCDVDELAPRLFSEEQFYGDAWGLTQDPPPGQRTDLVVGATFHVRTAKHWKHDNDQHLRCRTDLRIRIHHAIDLWTTLWWLRRESGCDCAISANCLVWIFFVLFTAFNVWQTYIKPLFLLGV